MRVLQLIDTLKPGGAERMAVTIANALSKKTGLSCLCCTREKGSLEAELFPEVKLLFLKKKSTLDLAALRKMRKFIRQEKIDIVQAHSSSFFLAAIIKMTGGNFKLVWHDHYGNSEFLEKRQFKVLKLFSGVFNGIIAVNQNLKNWAVKHLNCKNIVVINNFIPDLPQQKVVENRFLKGRKETFKIICIANLRPQKDHFNLLKAFEKIAGEIPVSLHLVGNNPKNSYSGSFLEAIQNSKVKDAIFYYGESNPVFPLLLEADLGILSSSSEGLPVTLLEYGMAGLPVVVTNVGECKKVVNGCGKAVEPKNPEHLYKAILYYYQNPDQRKADSINFNKRIIESYSAMAVLPEILEFYENL